MFVEFDDGEVARAALRGMQKNSVLGKGKRARGVTVTRSGQEELMRSVSVYLDLSIVSFSLFVGW